MNSERPSWLAEDEELDKETGEIRKIQPPYVAPTWEEIRRSGPGGRTGAMLPIWERWGSCSACTLRSGCNNVVIGSGNPDSPKIVIGGEGPGETEDQLGGVFIGKTGMLLTDVLNKFSINRVTDCYLLNAVCCRPPGNRTPTWTEIMTCRDRLKAQLQGLIANGTVKVLVLLGKSAYASLFGPRNSPKFDPETIKISKLLGWYDHQYAGIPPVYITYHPSYIARQGASAIRSAWEADWDAIKRFVEDGVQIHPRRAE